MLRGRLAQSAKVEGGGVQLLVGVQVGGGPSGPAVGAMPMDAPLGNTLGVVGVVPRSSRRKAVKRPMLIGLGRASPVIGSKFREEKKYAGSVFKGGGDAPVTRSGIATWNMAWFSFEVGDFPKTTAHFNPMSVAFTV